MANIFSAELLVRVRQFCEVGHDSKWIRSISPPKLQEHYVSLKRLRQSGCYAPPKISFPFAKARVST